MAEEEEKIIKNALVETMAQLDALRGLVLAMLDASKDKDSILAGFSGQSEKLNDLLLDSLLSDGFLAEQKEAYSDLLKLASRSGKPR